MNETTTIITIQRDVDAILIPSGQPITIPAGSEVSITQALGGSYTVYTKGNLARIAGKNLDALGIKPITETVATKTTDGKVNELLVWEQMRTCYDPEIPVNIVDLGLVYDCIITPLLEGGNRVIILMTLTAQGCGMGGFLMEDVRNKVLQVPNVTEVSVDLVFDPPWSQEMMSDEAKLQTGMYY